MGTSDGHVIGATKIVDHGSDSARWNLAILSEGYQDTELAQFATDTQSFVTTFSGTPPFDSLWPGVNVYRIDVASTESGADDPVSCGGSGATPATYFDATFCTNATARLLSVNQTTVQSVASAQVPSYHQALVIVNSSKYGGSGGSVAVFSTAPDASLIGIHETGHSAFGLADEYSTLLGCDSGEAGHDQYTGAEPGQPNVTATASPLASLKWGSLVDAGTALPTTSNSDCTKCDPQASPVPAGTTGAFEGAFYFHCGAYRPAYDCMMRTLGQPFCAVCQQRIVSTLQPFQPPAPVVTGVSPSSGAAGGGDSVTVAGTGFTGATAVGFGSVPASGFSVDSDSQITVTSPAPNVSGTVEVTVTTPAGTSATSIADQFTYMDGGN